MSVVLAPDAAHGGSGAWRSQRVDVCLPCDGLWLDAEELEGLDDA